MGFRVILAFGPAPDNTTEANKNEAQVAMEYMQTESY
jgi:hypothetical protein